MLLRSFQIALPRRVTAYFLLFSLAAIICLGVGVLIASSAVSQSQSTSDVLALVGKVSHRLALKYLDSGPAGLQSEVERLSRQNKWAYSAIVGTTGRYLAHSSAERIGEQTTEPSGATETWGELERVRYKNPQGLAFVEYRAPLRAGGRLVGSLRICAIESSRWSMFLAAAPYVPLALMGPLIFMGLGCVVLRRLVRPVADVERQLRKIAVAASVRECELDEVPVRGAASLGWNRLVEQRAGDERGADLHLRLNQSLEGVRHKRLAGILNSLPDGVLTTDCEGAITYHNTSAVALLERRQRPRTPDAADAESANPDGGRQPVKQPVQKTATPEQPESSADAALSGESLITWLCRSWQVPQGCPLLQTTCKDRMVVVELERSGEGERRVLRVTRSPLRIPGIQEQECHVWTLRDVTQQKLAEEMRTQFVDTATHELRTPLANIKAYAETLALQDVLDVEQQKDFLNTINSEATRLARFVDDLLSVSSMEIGSLSLCRQPTDLERLFSGVIGKVKPQTNDKNITFETQFPEKWPEPELDKEKIAATLVNLLGNAVKYTPAGGRVALRVKVNDGCLEISVEDTGFGIAPEDVPKLFDKFFRSDDPRVREVTGTGLGLSLAHEVVRLHGGKITVDSELNKGSTFLITLPLR